MEKAKPPAGTEQDLIKELEKAIKITR
ncbi:hypothetical protein CNEO3_890020 [Clostridium neonatale]|uniref:Uncharacterized protein n=1 Tax=Clostridium neonatale TaxID=137838 RepID=A0AA86ML77_9CLOT|nr:hypothetical protein CNEO_44107 [Clostridium neonatale]CAI3539959.1 hypothetical protein CNEO4_1250015 [Clostridium neonatale]CAI3546138.1 hypothetical protein CNEO4_1100022 [Clostridium neonatale]CAI3550024.1 hypothetical protein CNEO4_1010021 [Clostridium neonatale]CAI3563691.1 hypothetical protein CNEO4_1080021 [Clostridium neonatale]